MQAEQKILQLAIEKGLLNPTLAINSLEALVQKGILDQATISALQSELESRMSAQTSLDADKTSASAPVVQFPTIVETSPPRFGDFENLEFIGQGGMAKVYKAYDTKLGRLVALKLLRADDSEMAVRLLMEAKSQARIEHENVCKVYEAGEVDGKPYIAMQFIRGKTLKELRNEIPLEQKLRLMSEVADAVHSAHRAGMIHRDLKPANVMVERTEDGEYIPYVMDFGLAREAGSSGMTETGRVIGTIFYMSPEQARGHVRRLDRRSDVYSLGISLYELISDQIPYELESDMDFLLNLVDETKPIVRKMTSDVPGDLETIVMKCVEKEPRRRYDSAKALADDLRRYLDGEPILAKRTHLFYRLLKKAKKHRLLFSICVVALITILTMCGLWIRTRRNAAEQIKTAQELGQKVERIEAALRYMHLLPLHDATNELNEARIQVDRIRKQIQDKEGQAGEAPSYYAAGRGYLALGELDKAKELLEKAWNSGYRTTDVSFALGRTLGALYQREIEESEQTGTRLSRELRRKQLQKEFREPALRHLKEVNDSNLQSTGYYRALVAFYDGRHEDSLRETEAVHRKIPWMYEAKRLQGDVYATLAREVERTGGIDEALKLFEKAQQAYASAIQVGASDSENYQRLCRMKAAVIKSIFYKTALDPKKEFDEAIGFCDQASIANPANSTAPAARATVLNRWGEYQLFNYQDPEPALRKAMTSAMKAAQLNPEDHFPQHSLGFSYSLLAYYRILKNRNPLDEIEKSSEHYQKALQLKPKYTASLSGIGLVNQYKAEYLLSVGENPLNSFKDSINYREQAAKNDSRNTDMMNNLGNSYDTYANYLIESGGDPKVPNRKAIETFQEAIRINPNEPLLRANLTEAYITNINYQRMIGQDPSKEIHECIRLAEENIKLNPNHELSQYVLVDAYLLRIQNEISSNRVSDESIKKASEAVQVIVGGSREAEMPFDSMARLDLLSARANLLNKQSPENLLRSAITKFQKALEQAPMDQSILILVGECYLEIAEWKLKSHRSPESDIKAGLQVVESILQKNPRNSNAYSLQAKLLLIGIKPGGKSVSSAQIKASLDQALKLNSNLKQQVSKLSEQVNSIN